MSALNDSGNFSHTQSSVDDSAVMNEMENFKKIYRESSFLSPLKQLRKNDKEAAFIRNKLKTKKEAESISSLERNSHRGPDFYEILAQTGCSLHLNIPETLVYLHSKRKAVYLYTDSKGKIQHDDSKLAINLFFNQGRTEKAESVPKYTHIAMNEKINFCYTKDDALNHYENCPYFSHRLQHFIHPSSNRPSKTRVQWIANKPLKAYVLSSQKPYMHKRNRSDIHGKSTAPKYQHRRELSLVEMPVTESKSVELLKTEKSKFSVSFSDIASANMVRIHQFPDTLLSAIGVLIKFLKRFYFKTNELQELLLDFIRNSKHELVFLACAGYKLKYEQFETTTLEVSDLDLPKIPRERSLPQVVLEPSSDYQEERLRKQQSKLFSINNFIESLEYRSSIIEPAQPRLLKPNEILERSRIFYLKLKGADKYGRVPFNMIKLTPDAKKDTISTTIELERTESMRPTKGIDRIKSLSLMNQKSIDVVERSHNLLAKEIKRMERAKNAAMKGAKFRDMVNDLKTLFRTSTKVLLNAFKTFHIDIMVDPMLAYYFVNINKGDARDLAERLYRSLNPDSMLGVRTMLRKSHENLGISKPELDRYFEVFKNACEVHGLTKVETNLLLARAKYFEKEILSSNM